MTKPDWSPRARRRARISRRRRVARVGLLTLATATSVVAVVPVLVAALALLTADLTRFLAPSPWFGRNVAVAAAWCAVAAGPLWLASRRFRERPRDRPAGWGALSTAERTSLAASLATVVALVFAGMSLQVTRDQVELTARGQLGDRYAEAVRALASDRAEVRISGALSLERIALDPAEADHAFDLLAVFLRTRAARPASGPCDPAVDPVGETGVIAGVLARMSKRHGSGDADLRGTCLRTTGWEGADLDGADLREADLSEADLGGARLVGARLAEASLAGADLAGADLSGASLAGADLTGADLRHTDLTGAVLTGADLSGANVQHAKLPPNAPPH
ncbi:pentapeptide repeat-containing protein [Saccharothrix sp. BKS2]|uniref:pentapeptide repeat-containing protein n=1 Tax=Saccharothrix sp. BKS2 TaxID=3064400 RepID=UPI0039EAB8C2